MLPLHPRADGGDTYDAYVSSGELVCETKDTVGSKEAHAGIISQATVDLTKGYIFEVKMMPDVLGDVHEQIYLVLSKYGDETKSWRENIPVFFFFGKHAGRLP